MIPIRSCIACRKREHWTTLLHVVFVDGVAQADPGHRLQGRGAWIHLDCFEVAKSRSAFQRAFRVKAEIDLEPLAKFVRASRTLNKEY